MFSSKLKVLATLPLSVRSLKRLQILILNKDSVNSRHLESFDTDLLHASCSRDRLQAEVCRQIWNLCGVRARPVVNDEKLVILLCQGSHKKEIKKLIKKRRKLLGISVDKTGDDAVNMGEELRVALESDLSVALELDGWRKVCGNIIAKNSSDGFPLSNTKMHVKGITLDLQLGSDDNVVLILSPIILGWTPLQVEELIPKKFKAAFQKGDRVDLKDWLQYEGLDFAEDFKCTILPCLEKGMVVGFPNGNRNIENLDELKDTWLQEHGLKLREDPFLVEVIKKVDDEMAIILIPSCCLLTAAGATPVPPSVRNRENQASLESVLHAIQCWNFLGYGLVKIKLMSESPFPKHMELPADWTTGRSRLIALAAESSQESKGVNTAILLSNLSASSTKFSFRMPRPDLLNLLIDKQAAPMTKVPIVGPLSNSASKKTLFAPEMFDNSTMSHVDTKHLSRRATAVETCHPGDLEVFPKALFDYKLNAHSTPLLVKPIFLPRKPKASIADNHSSKVKEVAPKVQTSRLQMRPVLASRQRVSRLPSNVQDEAQKAADYILSKKRKNRVSDLEDTACKLATSSSKRGRGPAPAFVEKLVLEKFAVGNLKALTMPILKVYIIAKNIGKVCGKKNELLQRVHEYLAKEV